jgi:hypothetical protein
MTAPFDFAGSLRPTLELHRSGLEWEVTLTWRDVLPPASSRALVLCYRSVSLAFALDQMAGHLQTAGDKPVPTIEEMVDLVWGQVDVAHAIQALFELQCEPLRDAFVDRWENLHIGKLRRRTKIRAMFEAIGKSGKDAT